MDDLSGVQVSAEYLSHRFRRTQKLVTREALGICATLESYQQGTLPLENLTLAEIQQMKAQITALKKEILETDADERSAIRKAAVRLEHVMNAPPQFVLMDKELSSKYQAWNQTRIDALAADYLLRKGCVDAAEQLANEAQIQDFVDVEVFRSAKQVADAIMAQDISPALVWCANHASKLRRLESPLEFHIRKEEFLALVLSEEKLKALDFAREHLAPVAGRHSEQLMRLMGALAFPNLREAPREFSELLSEDRWLVMHDLFWTEMKRVYSIPETAPLTSLVQMGLISLKTNACMSNSFLDTVTNCAVCSEEGREIAQRLPNPYVGHTTLICQITGNVLDHDDPPLCLPNGHVLASSYVQSHSKQGRIMCPFTDDELDTAAVRPVYIV